MTRHFLQESLWQLLAYEFDGWSCQNNPSASTGTSSPVKSVDATSGNTVKIVSSLPMTGSSLGLAQSIVNGIADENQSTACDGKVKIEYEILDDATAAAGKWEPAQVTSNAKAVADPSVVALIGHFNPVLLLSIPVLNQADLVMVSPANTYPGLTKPGKGKQMSQTFTTRMASATTPGVVPADDLQGTSR